MKKCIFILLLIIPTFLYGYNSDTTKTGITTESISVVSECKKANLTIVRFSASYGVLCIFNEVPFFITEKDYKIKLLYSLDGGRFRNELWSSDGVGFYLRNTNFSGNQFLKLLSCHNVLTINIYPNSDSDSYDTYVFRLAKLNKEIEEYSFIEY